MAAQDSGFNGSGDNPAAGSSTENREHKELTIVGVGASAGGLTPLRNFFATIPVDTGMTFVVVIHLSPDYESVLADLLAGYTQMPVTQVQAKVTMEPNHVYVIPPGKRLLVSDGQLDLADLAMPLGQRLQIDTFFRSLAEEHGDGAAIILSGTGSDGAVGMKAIKEHGGLLLVQSPEEAEYDGMPRSAIATGLVDIVAPVAELATELVKAKRTQATLQLPQDANDLSKVEQQTLVQILTQLRMRTNHDFSGYREATIMRRIARRMQLVHVVTLPEYLDRLRQDGDEIDALYRDILIHVTEFFRDREAWETLAREVVPKLFADKNHGDTLRIWTVGCATGEEAYGLAMVLLEYASRLNNPVQVQIFASDLGRVALDFARKGIYPEAIAADVSEERLARFFIHENSHYEVRAEVRELVLFTPHNLLQDPPFSKLDLIVCRNVLIYLQRAVQERVYEAFHYALRPHGFLFLGSAESTGSSHGLFETVNKHHRLYRRSQQHPGKLILPALPLLPRRSQGATEAEKRQQSSSAHSGQGEQHRLLLEEMGPPSLLVDEHFRILHYSETAGRYLQHPTGSPTDDLVRLIRPELQSELRLALHRAFSQQSNAHSRPVPVKFNGSPHPVTILVQPTRTPGRALVLFWESSDISSKGIGEEVTSETDHRTATFEAQLLYSEQQLRGTKEEYESSVEELRAANEELQSTNEEYRSTLEELETSKEELQSINEELHSVNQEMKVRMDEIATANSDLQNLFAATEIATLFLDRDLSVKRYTPRAAELFNLMPPDKGRPIGHLRSKLNYATLEADVRRVMSNLMPIEREVEADDDRWFLVGVRPYRTVQDKIDGVVVTCVDITELKQAQESIRRSEERLRLTLEGVTDYAFITLDPSGQIVDWRGGAEQMFGYSRDEILGQPVAQLFTPEDREQGIPEIEIEQARTTGRGIDERWHLHKDGSRFYVSGVIVPLQTGGSTGFVKVGHDQTERRRIEEALESQVQLRTEQVRSLVTQLTLSEQEERRRISAILHDDLQQQLFSLNVQLAILRQLLDKQSMQEAHQVIDEIGQSLHDSIKVTRNLSVNLSPPILHNEGLFEAVRWLASNIEQQQGLRVEVTKEGTLPIPDEDLRVLLFQIVRELLFNVVKHAGISEAVVALRLENEQFRIEVSDKGRGFDTDKEMVQSSQGLLRISQRLELIGGRFEVNSSPGQGTHIIMRVPYSSVPYSSIPQASDPLARQYP